jgi:hypothetical protein
MRSLSTRAAGLLTLILGVWGGLIPFIGPYFHFTLGPNKAWTWTSGRLYVDVLPGIAAVLAGLILLRAGPRPGARLGALLALGAGIWFAIGPDVSQLWNAAGAQGAAHGSRGIRVLEVLAYHTGLGAVMAAIAGYALPRFFAPAVPVAETRPAVAPASARYAAEEPALVGSTTAAEEPALVGPTTAEPDPAAAAPATSAEAVDGAPATTAEAVDGEKPAAAPAGSGSPAPMHGQRRRRGGLLSVLSRR